MEIPENWQEELLLHDWKMMRIERCRDAFLTGASYNFPNGIHLEYATIRVNLEKAPAVMTALSDWEPKKSMERGLAKIRLDSKRHKELTVGELEDFKWRIYSLDI